MTGRLKNKILPAVFIVFIFSLLIGFILLPKSGYSENEKRVLAKFPTFSADTLKSGEFTDGLEKYLSDHFPFREKFIGLNAYLSLCLGQNGKNGVYKASDGYLITAPGAFDEARMVKNAGYIEYFAGKSKLPSYVLIIPEAGYTLCDKLPKNHKVYSDDKIFACAEKNIPSARLIDVRNAFNKAKGETELYYKTDHHLTSKGALTVYGEFCKATGHEEKDFSLAKTVSGFYGTTYSKSGLWGTAPDNLEIYKCNSSSKYTVKIDDGKGEKVYDSLYFENHLKNADKYPVFLDGNHALVKITNESVKNGKKLLLIKDSYAHCFATFIAEDYEEIVMVDLRYYKKPLTGLCEQEGFTELLFLLGAENINTSTDLSWLLM